MTTLSISPPFPIFSDRDGSPLENGYIWVGTANVNPITNPIAVYWDAALTQPAALPVRTINGYPANSGTPGRLFTGSADYSLTVQDSKGSLVYSALAKTEQLGDISAAQVIYQPAGSGAQSRTVESKLRDVYSFQDLGAVGNDLSDDTVSMQAAIDAVATAGGGTLMGKVGLVYRISTALVLKIGVHIDLCGATIKQYANNTQIITSPTGSDIYFWSLRNGYLRYNTAQDGTSTISVTVTGTLNAGDIFVGLTSGGSGRVVSVAGGVLTYLAGPGALVSGEALSVNAQTQATTSTGPTNTKCGIGLRLANGASSWNYAIEDLWILDAYDGITSPSTAGTFAFVGRIKGYTASVARWAIDYDCDSSIGGNTNVILQNCWHLHSQSPPAPFSSGFRFNACSMFRWDSVLADKIQGQFLYLQTSSGKVGTISLEAASLSAVASLEASAIQLSDSNVSIDTAIFVGNTFKSLNTISVAITGTIVAGNTITDGGTGASGVVVSVSGSRVTFTQNTLNTNFVNGNTVLVGGVSQGTVSAVPGSSGLLSLIRATSSVRYRQFSTQVVNFLGNGNSYAGKDIYEVAPTADNAVPASGPFLVYNTQATLDRTSVSLNITGTIAVGNTITGATSGAAGVVTAVGTFLVQYKPSNDIQWTVGENVQVGGVTQATVLGMPAYPGNLADFATPPSVKMWNGVYRDINASGPAARIRGDMTNATLSNRMMFQSSVTNGTTSVAAIPNGTATGANYAVANSSDPNNAAVATFEVGPVTAGINSAKTGTGTTLPLRFSINGNTTMEITTGRNVSAGIGTLATNATDGFLYVPTCAGTPTGVPTSLTGFAPIVVNTTNNKLYFYSGGSWRDAGP